MEFIVTEGLRSFNTKQVTAANAKPSAIIEDMYVARASELKLAPGVWPKRLTTDLGNGQDFCLVSQGADGARRYEQSGPIALRVLNN